MGKLKRTISKKNLENDKMNNLSRPICVCAHLTLLQYHAGFDSYDCTVS